VSEAFSKILEFLQAFGELLKFWFIVDQEQLCFRRTLGKHGKAFGPGIHLKWPFFQKAEYEDSRPYVYLLDPQSLTTKDGVMLVLRLTVTVEVADIRKYYRNVFDGRQNVQDVAAGELGEAVRACTAADVMGNAVLARVSRKLRSSAKKWGMKVSDVRFVDCSRARSIRLWQTQTSSMGQE
jgi:regulator of protease activity HflC (stomatin/prohibitin superfamily)